MQLHQLPGTIGNVILDRSNTLFDLIQNFSCTSGQSKTNSCDGNPKSALKSWTTVPFALHKQYSNNSFEHVLPQESKHDFDECVPSYVREH